MLSKLKLKLAGSHGIKDSKDVNTALGSNAGTATAAASNHTASSSTRESTMTTRAPRAQPPELRSEVITDMTDTKTAPTASDSSSKGINGEACSTHVQVTKPVLTEPSSVALWDRAYAQLSAEKQDLMKEYTQLLSDALKTNDHDSRQISDDPLERREQMDKIIRLGLEHMKNKHVKVTIAGHEIDLHEQSDNLVGVLIWSKDWISEAVQDVPYANAVWAGISLILPILTNPSEIEKANKEGFTYVTSQMRWYKIVESMLLPKDMLPDVRKELEERFVELYKLIIDFQAQSVLRCYRSRTKNYIRGAIKWDDWASMEKEIKNMEALLDAKVKTETATASRSHLDHIAHEAEEARKSSQQLVSLVKKQLEVQQNAALAIHKNVQINERRLEVELEAIEARRKQERQAMNEKERNLLQLFNITDYEGLKDQVDDRIDGTCLWFLDHDNYKTWLEAPMGPLLVSADPGCGKSVLAKYLIEKGLPRSSTICYFFFKDRQETTVKAAFCSLIHQLVHQHPTLIRHIQSEGVTDKSQMHNGLLWKIIENCCGDPQVGSVIFVLDALDECDGTINELGLLARSLNRYFSDVGNAKGQLKVLLTSRPYDGVTQEFRDLEDSFPQVRIHGEKELDSISGEVDKVIEFRIQRLFNRRRISTKVKDHLRDKLLQTPQKTYLWVHLFFRYLDKNMVKNTPAGVDAIIDTLGEIDTLPGNIFDVYERTLNRSGNHKEVRRALSIVASAYEPLTMEQLSLALAVSPDPDWLDAWVDEDSADFEERMRDISGLLIRVFKGKVIFIHQTVKDFLLLPRGSAPNLTNSWRHGLTEAETHKATADAAMLYVEQFLSSSDQNKRSGWRKAESRGNNSPRLFYRYAAKNWVRHIRDAGEIPEDRVQTYAGLMNPREQPLSTWIIEWLDGGFLPPMLTIPNTYDQTIQKMSVLTLQALFGHAFAVRQRVQAGWDIEGLEDWYDLEEPRDYFSPLRAACFGGYDEIIRYLVESGADMSHTWKGSPFGTNLIECLEGDPSLPCLLEYLVSKGLDIKKMDSKGWTPLSLVRNSSVVLRTLCELGADVDAMDPTNQTTAVFRQRTVENVEILLEFGASVNIQLDTGYTYWPFSASYDLALLRIYLENGLPVETKFLGGQTPVFLMSAMTEYLPVLEEYGASFTDTNDIGRNALFFARETSQVEFLVDRGVNVNHVDIHGTTPLHSVTTTDAMKALVSHGANLEARDKHGRTPLMEHSLNPGTYALTKFLLEQGANFNALDNQGRTALHLLCERMNDPTLLQLSSLINLAQEFNLDINIKDGQGNTALHTLFNTPRQQVVKGLPGRPQDGKMAHTLIPLRAKTRLEAAELFLESGFDLGLTNNAGRTVLHESCACAMETGGVKAMKFFSDKEEKELCLATKFFIARGADIFAKDAGGHTPFELCRKEEYRVQLTEFSEKLNKAHEEKKGV